MDSTGRDRHARSTSTPAAAARDTSPKGSGEKLRVLRLRADATQQSIANALGLSLATISRLERKGRGHNYARVQQYLEGLIAGTAEPQVTIVTSTGPTDQNNSALGSAALPTIYRRYSVLKAMLSQAQRHELDDYERHTYTELLEALPDQQSREQFAAVIEEQKIRLAVLYMTQEFGDAPGADDRNP